MNHTGRLQRYFALQFVDQGLSMESRRTFVWGAGAAVSGLAASKMRSANDTVRVAVLGLNGRGRDHIAGFSGLRSAIYRAVGERANGARTFLSAV